MTPEQVFLREGAAYFGNRLIYRNKDVGLMSASGLVLTPEGEEAHTALANITDVEVKVKPGRPKKQVETEPVASVDSMFDAE